jgi:hypothetical protein
MTRRTLLLAASVVSLNAALLSSASAATCVTSVATGFTNVVNSVSAETGSAVTGVTPAFGNALTTVQTAETPGSFLTGSTLATTSALAVNDVSVTFRNIGSINNPGSVNALATNPGGTFFQVGQSNVVFADNPPGIQNVPVITGTPVQSTIVGDVSPFRSLFLTGEMSRPLLNSAG